MSDTGILSLNLKIDKSCLKTVNGNLKSTATIKIIIFPISREEYLQVCEIWLDCAIAQITKEGALVYLQSKYQMFRP